MRVTWHVFFDNGKNSCSSWNVSLMSVDRFWFCIELAKILFCITLWKHRINLNRKSLHLTFIKCLCTKKYLWLQIEQTLSSQTSRYSTSSPFDLLMWVHRYVFGTEVTKLRIPKWKSLISMSLIFSLFLFCAILCDQAETTKIVFFLITLHLCLLES